MNKVTILSLIACTILSSSVFAQGRPVYGRENLESRVTDLEWKLEQTNRRLERLERDLLNPRPPTYEERVDFDCMVIDSTYGKAFMGTGRTKLDAEAVARQVCTSGSYGVGSYCTGATKCSSGFKNPAVKGYVCVVTDTTYGKTYRAEGKNEIEAEVKALQTCTEGSYGVGTYCSKGKIRCEAF